MVIDNILKLKSTFSSCGLAWANRFANGAAHEIASLAVRGCFNPNWCVRIPPSVDKILHSEAVRT